MNLKDDYEDTVPLRHAALLNAAWASVKLKGDRWMCIQRFWTLTVTVLIEGDSSPLKYSGFVFPPLQSKDITSLPLMCALEAIIKAIAPLRINYRLRQAWWERFCFLLTAPFCCRAIGFHFIPRDKLQLSEFRNLSLTLLAESMSGLCYLLCKIIQNYTPDVAVDCIERWTERRFEAQCGVSGCRHLGS